jgi:glycosyltransferase involved in cell wall biosynthesis
MRAMNTADALVGAGHRVVLWSSAFYHQEKRHRTRAVERISVTPVLEIVLVPSPGYGRNIGPARLWDHAVLARNLAKLLRAERTPPDVGFVGYPPIETAAVMVRWLRDRRVPALLDVKDLWPSLFLEALPAAARPAGRVALMPYFRLARRAMAEAAGLTAMAEGFLGWALEFAGRGRWPADLVVPFASPDVPVPEAELAAARQWWDRLEVRDSRSVRVCFVGSHSPGMDFVPIRDAAKRCAESGAPCQFVICGDGECSAEWRASVRGLPNVLFPGWIDRPKIVALAERSDAALAPYRIRLDFTLSIPNKVVDALALGLPVVSPLPGEVADLVSTRGVGLRYGAESGRSLYDCMVALMADGEARAAMTRNAKELYERSFTFAHVYGGLVRHIESLAPAPAARPGA